MLRGADSCWAACRGSSGSSAVKQHEFVVRATHMGERLGANRLLSEREPRICAPSKRQELVEGVPRGSGDPAGGPQTHALDQTADDVCPALSAQPVHGRNRWSEPSFPSHGAQARPASARGRPTTPRSVQLTMALPIRLPAARSDMTSRPSPRRRPAEHPPLARADARAMATWMATLTGSPHGCSATRGPGLLGVISRARSPRTTIGPAMSTLTSSGTISR